MRINGQENRNCRLMLGSRVEALGNRKSGRMGTGKENGNCGNGSWYGEWKT